jgi:hypothetical protein
MSDPEDEFYRFNVSQPPKQPTATQLVDPLQYLKSGPMLVQVNQLFSPLLLLIGVICPKAALIDPLLFEE